MTHKSKALGQALLIEGCVAFNVNNYISKRKLNQYCVRYDFDDSTWLKVFAYRAEYSGIPGKPCYFVIHKANKLG